MQTCATVTRFNTVRTPEVILHAGNGDRVAGATLRAGNVIIVRPAAAGALPRVQVERPGKGAMSEGTRPGGRGPSRMGARLASPDPVRLPLRSAALPGQRA